MREILFRGKTSTEWVYGDLRHLNDGRVAIRKDGEIYPYEVIPEAVGEWTGLCDKNGVKIFEDDIVKVPSVKPEVMHIGFIEGAFCLTDLNGKYAADIHYIHPAGVNESEVIGNIHDNPEMMEVSKC